MTPAISKSNKKRIFEQPPSGVKVGMISLGCDKNRVDSEVMLGILKKRGYEITANKKEADIIIINTCSFIPPAEKESIDTIKEIIKTTKSRIIVSGCLVQKYKSRLSKWFPEVKTFIGCNDFYQIDKLLSNPKNLPQFMLSSSQFLYNDEYPRLLTTPSHYAYLKIAEGCSYNCTFCLIPKLRGKYRSREISSIIKEAKGLAQKGVKELILVAQDTTYYGKDIYGKYKLAEVLKKLAKIEGIEWIRIQYFHPFHFTDELIEVIAEEEKICKYIDLPLQHSEEEILKKMGRLNTFDKALNIIFRLRKYIPGVCLRTTFIVGFPGEKERDFNNLLKFIENIKFDKLGAFMYYPEKGTKSYYYQDQVPEKIKIERYNILMQKQKEISLSLNQKFLGKRLKVIIDKREGNFFIARSYREAPEIDGSIYLYYTEPCGQFLRSGDLVWMKVNKSYPYELEGEADQT